MILLGYLGLFITAMASFVLGVVNINDADNVAFVILWAIPCFIGAYMMPEIIKEYLCHRRKIKIDTKY